MRPKNNEALHPDTFLPERELEVLMKNEKHISVVRLTSLALLAALIVVLQTVASGIKIGPVPISLTLVPIVVGAILFGPGAGAGKAADARLHCRGNLRADCQHRRFCHRHAHGFQAYSAGLRGRDGHRLLFLRVFPRRQITTGVRRKPD